jgi:hypothetical protein
MSYVNFEHTFSEIQMYMRNRICHFFALMETRPMLKIDYKQLQDEECSNAQPWTWSVRGEFIITIPNHLALKLEL